jgi:hypothetical protein
VLYFKGRSKGKDVIVVLLKAVKDSIPYCESPGVITALHRLKKKTPQQQKRNTKKETRIPIHRK